MKRHPTDTLSLVFGLLLAAIGLVLLAGGDGPVSLSWVAPLGAVVLGVLLMFAARSTASEPPAQPLED